MVVVGSLVAMSNLIAMIALARWLAANQHADLAEVDAGYLATNMASLKSSSLHFLAMLITFLIFDMELLLALSLVDGGRLATAAGVLMFVATTTSASSQIGSAIVVAAGLLLMWLRLATMNAMLGATMLAMGVLTITMAGMLALSESDMKKLVAFSTLRQMGLLLIALAATAGANQLLFHVLSHAYFKASLFICLSALLASYSRRQQDAR